MQDIVLNQESKVKKPFIKHVSILNKEKGNTMTRNKLITQAILDKLNTGTGIYTAEDILVAANISDQNLQELLKQLEGGVAELTKKQKE